MRKPKQPKLVHVTDWKGYVFCTGEKERPDMKTCSGTKLATCPTCIQKYRAVLQKLGQTESVSIAIGDIRKMIREDAKVLNFSPKVDNKSITPAAIKNAILTALASYTTREGSFSTGDKSDDDFAEQIENLGLTPEMIDDLRNLAIAQRSNYRKMVWLETRLQEILKKI